MSSPGLRERKKAKTRRAIQEHALRLIAEQGYDATTVEQIAEAAEVSPSTFFRYFPTKEDAIIEDEYDPLIAAAFARHQGDGPPLEAARRALSEAFGEIYERDRERIRARVLLFLAVPQLRARTYDNLTRTEDLIAEAIAGYAGRAKDDLAVRTFAGAMVGGWMAGVRYWAETGKGELPEILDSVITQLESGLPV